MDARELSALLADRAGEIAAYLLPNGKPASGMWRVGSVDGETGQSMAVHIKGSKRGRWTDFATGEHGDLLDLFAARHGNSIADGMREAARYLGVSLGEPRLKDSKRYTKPERPAATKPRSRVLDWLHSRGLTDATIEAFKIAATKDDDAVIFPFLRDGELVNTKTRLLAEKKMWQAKDAEPCLFGWHLIDPKKRVVCITEGEIDAMSLHQMGFAALSCNQGAGNHQWLDTDWTRLQRFSDILVCYDNDEAGQKGAAEVCNRLGLDRCRIVTFPVKDANEYLLAGASREDFMQCMERAKTIDPAELVSGSDFVDDVIRDIYPVDGVPTDPPLFLGSEHAWFRFRPGEVSVWTGFNGHGKSQMLNQAMLGLMRMDERVLIFSGEMDPRKTMSRATRQAAGTDEPTIAYIRAIGQWFGGRLWLYKHIGQVNTDALLEVFAYGAKRYGIRHFVLDSLMMLEDVPEEGKGALEAQRKLMLKLMDFAKRYGAHVNLVAHPKKAENEDRSPGKQSVSGSGKITSMADNVFSVWAKLRDENEPSDGSPDAKLELLKQRDGDEQHKTLWLWFDKKSLQYRSIRHNGAIQYVEMNRERG